MKPKVINCTVSYNDGALSLFIAHSYIHLQKCMLLDALMMKVVCTSVKLKQLQNSSNALKCTFYILVAQRRQSTKRTEINKYLIMRMPIKLPLNYLDIDSVRMGLSF